MKLTHLSKLEHDLAFFQHVASSSWIHAVGLSSFGNLLVLFEYPDGHQVCYEYIAHHVGSFVILAGAFSTGTAYRSLDLKHAAAEKREGSLIFSRPFDVFVINESWHESLRVDVDVKHNLSKEGAYHNYYTTATIGGYCDYQYFTEEYHGHCRYDIGVYMLDHVLTEFSLTPVPEGMGDKFKDKIAVFKGQLYGDIEVQVRRVALP